MSETLDAEPPVAPTAEAPPPKAKKKKKHLARVSHKTPGRIRLKIPTAKHNPALLATYTAAFSAIPGLLKVEAREETGSILIYYDVKHEASFHGHLEDHFARHDTEVTHEKPGDEISELAQKIENEAEFLAQRSEVAKFTVDAFKVVDRELKAATDNAIDLKIVLAGGLAAFTFLEIGAEAATPMWVTLALFSLNHFAELQVPHTPGAGMPVGGAAKS